MRVGSDEGGLHCVEPLLTRYGFSWHGIVPYLGHGFQESLLGVSHKQILEKLLPKQLSQLCVGWVSSACEQLRYVVVEGKRGRPPCARHELHPGLNCINHGPALRLC